MTQAALLNLNDALDLIGDSLPMVPAMQPTPDTPCPIDRILAKLQSQRLERQRVPVNRRGEFRFPFPSLIRVIPVDRHGKEQGEPLVVVGKHLSKSGLGFFHEKPLPYRNVVAEFQESDTPVRVLMDLLWCRFRRECWYESGGKFLRTI